MNIAICDDDIVELEKIKSVIEDFILQKQTFHQITFNSFTNGDDLLRHIEKYGGFDLLILDIIIPGMNGIELATEIRSKNISCKIIFLTSSPEFAVNSYSVDAFYYMLKPFSENELYSLLNKVLFLLEKEKENSIIIKETGKLTRIKFHTIQYVESLKHNIYFHLSSDDVLCCYRNISEFSIILTLNKEFIKCHKSFIVNMNYVTSITNNAFIMCNKAVIPISRQIYHKVKNSYIDYFFNKGDGSDLSLPSL